jgi:hypothetical protein
MMCAGFIPTDGTSTFAEYQTPSGPQPCVMRFALTAHLM